MSQLTVRGLDKRLLQAIRDLARRERISLNKAALRLLERGAGLAPTTRDNRIGSSLDHLAGTWTAAETKAFEQALKSCEQIDEACGNEALTRHERLRRVEAWRSAGNGHRE